MAITGVVYNPMTGNRERQYGPEPPKYPTYKPYEPAYPTTNIPQFQSGGMGAYPEATPMPTYEPGGGAYPITQLPTYKPTGEAYPGYQQPETGGVTTELQESIRERMTGAGTAGAESAIYERGEERVNREYEDGLTRIDEEMAGRGLTGSGIHGEAINKLKEEKQRSLADLGRQITIYGQQAIESAMAQGQQYVEYQSAEAARELQVKERGWQGRVGEQIRGYESAARAAEAKGQSQQAAYQTAIAERVRSYEAQARATSARNEASTMKWQAEANVHMQKYQFELQRAGMLQQAKTEAWQTGQAEYQRAYESKYQATKDRWQADQYAREAAEKKAQSEWERRQAEIERIRAFNIARGPSPTWSPGWGGMGAYQDALAAWGRGVNISEAAMRG